MVAILYYFGEKYKYKICQAQVEISDYIILQHEQSTSEDTDNLTVHEYLCYFRYCKLMDVLIKKKEAFDAQCNDLERKDAAKVSLHDNLSQFVVMQFSLI